MKPKFKTVFLILLVLSTMLFASVTANAGTSSVTLKLKAKKKTVTKSYDVGTTVKVKLKDGKKTVKLSKCKISNSSTAVAKVNKKKNSITIRKKGTAQITFKYKKRTAVLKITTKKKPATPAPTPTNASIAINISAITVARGDMYTLTAIVSPSSVNQAVTWASSNTNIATVDQKGHVTGKNKGNATITATSAYNGKTASCSVTVNAPLKSISWSDEVTAGYAPYTELPIGKTKQLSIKYNPSDTTDSKTVTWKSSNTNLATVSSSGLVTGKGEGVVTITATCGYKSTSRKIVIVNVTTVSEISFTPTFGQSDASSGGYGYWQITPSREINPSKLRFVINNNTNIYEFGHAGETTTAYMNALTRKEYGEEQYGYYNEVIVGTWQNPAAWVVCKYTKPKGSNTGGTITLHVYDLTNASVTIPISIIYDGKQIASGSRTTKVPSREWLETRAYTNQVQQEAFSKYPHATDNDKVWAVYDFWNDMAQNDPNRFAQYNCVYRNQSWVFTLRDCGYKAVYGNQYVVPRTVSPTIVDIGLYTHMVNLHVYPIVINGDSWYGNYDCG